MTFVAISEETKNYSNKIVERLKESLGDKLHKVILFGSRARGEETEDSDIDLIIIGDFQGLKQPSRTRLTSSVIQDIHVPKDILAMTQEEYDSPRFLLRYIIEDDKVVLYERPN